MRQFRIYQGDELRIPYQLPGLEWLALTLSLLNGQQQLVTDCGLSTGTDDDGPAGYVFDTAYLPAGVYWLVLDAANDYDSRRVTDKLLVERATVSEPAEPV